MPYKLCPKQRAALLSVNAEHRITCLSSADSVHLGTGMVHCTAVSASCASSSCGQYRRATFCPPEG